MSSSLLFTAWLGLFVGQITTATTTTAPPAESKVMLEFQIQQTFTVTPELANTSPAAIQTLATQVVSAMDDVYRARFFNFNRNVVKGFSLGSVKVEAELIFNGIAAPNATSVVDALVEAASSSNFSLPVNPSSIVAIATTTTAPPAESKVMLEFKIQQTFTVTPELANTSPAAIQTLATQVVSVMDNVYRATFSNFNRTVVKSFSSGSVQVEAELIFNGIAAPNATSVVNTLVEAASSSNVSLPVNTSSIVATVTSPQTQAATASALLTTINTNSGNATSPPVNATSPQVNATLLYTHATSPPVIATSPQVNATLLYTHATSPIVHTTSLPVTAATTPGNTASPPVNATSPPVNATSPPVNATSPPVNATSPPVNATSPQVNATLPIVHTTSLPVTAATTPGNATSPPVNATSPPVNATLPIVHATSPIVHATSLPVTAATTPGNATSPPVNATSPPVNATSPPVNATLPIVHATLPIVHTTSLPVTAATTPGKTTSPPVNATSPPVIATSPQVNATLLYTHATSPIVHTTSLPDTAATTPGNTTSPPVNATSPPVNSTSLPELTIFSPAQVKMISSNGELTEDEIASHIDKFFKQISGNAFGPFKVTVKRVNKQKKTGT